MGLARSTCLALALHGGLALAGRWATGPERAPERPEQRYEVSVVELPEQHAPLPLPEAAQSAGTNAGGRALASARVAAHPKGAQAAPAAGATEAAPAGSGGEPAGEPETPATPDAPVDLGLGRLWLGPGLPERPRKAGGWTSGAEAAGGLGQGLEQADQARGLGRGGVVATLARGAAITHGPREGEATFLVMVDREGRVQSVSLGDERGGWGGVGRALARALARKRLRVPPGASGLSIQVRVEAKAQLPSGADPKHPVRGAGAGAEFDVADIAATPSRVVSARVTAERLL